MDERLKYDIHMMRRCWFFSKKNDIAKWKNINEKLCTRGKNMFEYIVSLFLSVGTRNSFILLFEIIFFVL